MNHTWCWKCLKCNVRYCHDNPNFSTSHAYELQQFVLRAKRWDEFVSYAFWYPETGLKREAFYDHEAIYWLFSDASRFADLVAEFRGYKPEGKEGEGK
jgi:hypothetical protein